MIARFGANTGVKRWAVRYYFRKRLLKNVLFIFCHLILFFFGILWFELFLRLLWARVCFPIAVFPSDLPPIRRAEISVFPNAPYTDFQFDFIHAPNKRGKAEGEGPRGSEPHFLLVNLLRASGMAFICYTICYIKNPDGWAGELHRKNISPPIPWYSYSWNSPRGSFPKEK